MFFDTMEEKLALIENFISRQNFKMEIQPLIDFFIKKNPNGYLSAEEKTMFYNQFADIEYKKTKNKVALFHYLNSALWGIYVKIGEQVIVQFKKMGIKINVDVFINNINPVYGGDFWSDLKSDCDYRTNQIVKSVESSFFQKKEYEFDAKTIKNFLLHKTQTQHVGLIDKYASTLVGLDNLAQLKKRGFKKALFNAVIDKKTTVVCHQLDGKIFKIDELIIGVTAPPIAYDEQTDTEIPHPCRSWLIGI